MLNLCAAALFYFLLVDDDSICACTPAEDAPTLRLGANVVDLGAERHHVDRKAVASGRCLSSQHTGIDTTTHAGNQLSGDAAAVALNLVSSAHTIGSNDVRLFSGCQACE